MTVPGADRLDRWRSLVHVLAVVVFVVLVGAVVVAAVPGLVGMDESYVVRSDSMSPAIDAGSVVFVTSTPAATLQTGDVITFTSDGAETRVTHRIVEVVEQGDGRAFRTQGDANDVTDSNLVRSDQVVGSVAFSVPLLGYLVSFAQSRTGLLLLVIVPGILLVVSELWQLHRSGVREQGGGESP